jgi:segregation and condensation protein A
LKLAGNVQLAVSLPHFDGAFDLLLNLIRRNEYPMDDLPIAQITGQFLGYVRQAQSLDIDLGGEFVETAAWLVLLKSRSMLPREAAREAQQELREAVEKHYLDREELNRTMLLLGGLRSERQRIPAAGAAPGRHVEESDEKTPPKAEDVMNKVRSAIASLRAHDSFRTTEAAPTTVAEQIAWVLSHTGQFPAGTAFSTDPWFSAETNIESRASLFLALLELVRTGEVLLHQRQEYGPILLKRVENEGRKQKFAQR